MLCKSTTGFTATEGRNPSVGPRAEQEQPTTLSGVFGPLVCLFIVTLHTYLKCFSFLSVHDVLYGEGEASTKKGAKEIAAKQMLARLRMEAERA